MERLSTRCTCASGHVGLGANQVIPPADKVGCHSFATSDDEMTFKRQLHLPDPWKKWKFDINMFEHATHSGNVER